MTGARPLLLLAVLLGGLLALKSLSLLDEASALFAERAYAATLAPEEDNQDAPDEEAEAEDDNAPPPPPLRDTGPRELPSASRLSLERGLAVRRRELDNRERELDTREQLLVVAEQRVDERIVRLEELRDEVQGLLGQLDTQRESQIDEIVASYKVLEPDAAARIFTAMRDSDPDTLLLVAERYQRESARNFSAVIAEMQPEHAAELITALRARAEALESTAEAEVRRVAEQG